LDLRDPSNTLIATTTAGGANLTALLQNVPITPAGTYTITVSSSGATSGTYTLGVTLDAALEAENNGGAVNDTLATAQNINSSFIPIGGASSGALRGAVLGSNAPSSGNSVL